VHRVYFPGVDHLKQAIETILQNTAINVQNITARNKKHMLNNSHLIIYKDTGQNTNTATRQQYKYCNTGQKYKY